MAQCLLLLLLLSRCCYFPPLLPLRLPQPTSFSVSFSCSLSRQLKLIRIFIKFQCLKGCKTSCTWPLPLPYPLHPSSPFAFPPSLYCSCPKCLAALYSSRKSRRRKSRWRKLRRRNQRRPQCKAADKVCSPPSLAPLPPSLCRNLAKSGAWLGTHLAWLELNRL